MTLIVRSKRPVLIAKAVIIFAVASLIGWAVEALGLLPMNRVSNDVGLPVVLILFAFFGFLIAITTVKDHWGHQITFEKECLRIRDSLGTSCVQYNEVEEVKPLAYYGAGIKLKLGSPWLAAFEGSPPARQKMERISRNVQRVYDCDLALPWETLDIGVDRFVDELRQRLPDKAV